MVDIKTARLTIRPFTLDDAPFVLRLLNEPSFIENIADKGVRDLEGRAATCGSLEEGAFLALLMARRLGAGHTVGTVICNSGLKYLSTDLYATG